MSVVGELKRRNVFRMAVLYVVVAWLIMQVAEVIVSLGALPERAGQPVLLLLAIGFPIALIFSWFYELTPEGISLEKNIESHKSITHITGRRMDFLVISLLSAGLLMFSYDKWWPRGPIEQSIAVLPFVNLSDDRQQDYFSDGLSEDILNLLVKVPEMRVISRYSAFSFKGQNLDVRTIAAKLNVAHILDGSVRRSGNTLRITVRLIEAKSDTNLWSQRFDRELTAKNIFGIQSEVALNIVNRLQATLSSDERQRLAVVPTQNLEAYEAYLLGKQEITRRTIISLQAAVEQFRRATELDPDFALAYVGLADSYAVLQDWGYLSRENVLPVIRAAATKALELDGQLGEAYVSLAGLYEVEGDYAAAETAYTRAIELNPGYATAHSWYGNFLRWRMGRLEEAVEQAEQALTLNPLSALFRMAYGDALSMVGRFEDALSQYRKSIELDPEFGGAHTMIAYHYLYAYTRTYDALESYRNVVAVEPNPASIGDIGEVYLVLGDTAAAERWTEQARLADPENLSVSKHLALLNYYRGQDDLAEGFALKSLEGPFYVDTPYMLFILRNADLHTGRYANARLRYEQFYPALAEEDPVVHRSNYRAAIDLSVVLERMGETQRSQRLLEKSLLAIRNMPRLGLFGYGSADAEIHALQGRSEEGLLALRLAVEDGWRQHWFLWTELNPNLDSIRDEPEYGAIIAKLESDMAIELARVQARESQPSGTVQ